MTPILDFKIFWTSNNSKMVQAIVKISKYRTFIERITWDTPNANANANALIELQRQTNIKVSFNDDEIFVKSVEWQHLLEVVLHRFSNSDEFKNDRNDHITVMGMLFWHLHQRAIEIGPFSGAVMTSYRFSRWQPILKGLWNWKQRTHRWSYYITLFYVA